MKGKITTQFLRSQIIGRNKIIKTPYGEKLLTYADYTASGRSLYFIEKFILDLLKNYANSHTEDDFTGKYMTNLLHQAEHDIKKEFNATENCYIIPTGTGSTGGIERLLTILGLYFPPAVRKNMLKFINEDYEFNQYDKYSDLKRINEKIVDNLPVVFISAYEHHSNDLMWREALTEVIEIDLNEQGLIDLDDLKKKVGNPKLKNRLKIGSFSAASNVTGIKSPVYEIARILHEHNALACFDFAGSAPYVEINMNKDKESYFDAIALSPHKFLGGPGSSGLLLINKRLYDSSLPPTVAAGGTVDYVSAQDYIFLDDVEAREKPGTPGILQIIRAALAIKVKSSLGLNKIDEIEQDYLNRAFHRLKSIPNLEILGNQDPNKRIPIVSFLIRNGDKYLHPRFVTNLLNDLFGIQSRAGCSCAGPYGHRLLDIDEEKSSKIKNIILKGFQGIKPGWTRVNFHYTIDESEFSFILDAIEFIAKYGKFFIQEYTFNVKTGDWIHNNAENEVFSLDINSLTYKEYEEEKIIPDKERENLYHHYIEQANMLANKFEKKATELKLNHVPDKQAEELQYFDFVNGTS
jgi:selenocysteine lyase/cysteine desulfurase